MKIQNNIVKTGRNDMGKQLVWQDRFNIGIDVIDKEHKKLFSIINRMLLFKDQEDKSQWVCQEGIKYFKDHAMKHFTEEEAYMASIDYIGFETHRRLHDSFRRKTLPELEKELARTKYSIDAINHFLGVCAGWLIGHTLTEDHAIIGKGVSMWGDLLPEKQQAAMGQEIIQLVYDLFQIEAHIISDHYGGEKFGNGIYYRMVYSTQQNDNWEFFLIFEEKLILNTVGMMMGVASEEVSVMLVNATRYLAQQFVTRIREHFPSADLYEMKEENLLTYEQFNRIFEKEHPQCSLLFNTGGKGYFAYCVMAPHLLQKGIEGSIKAENAMVEIQKYLKKESPNNKKKILVVDDSTVVREAMKKLLSESYEVSTVSSGVSAIRSITLNRPDLVLLDYEMPVCDGSQVLGMIRAEEGFEDIPVIFLTGRGDRESIQKVMALKPNGYLLKTMKPVELKKNIDEYFQKNR